ncbi:MAG: hypothetical protein AAFV93_04590 [Chloroflexota bacterium]
MSDGTRHDDRWAKVEQWFMRGLGIGLLVVAVISMIFGLFPVERGGQLTFGINIGVTLFLGIGALWSLWWSSDLNRMYNLIDRFKESGSARTYAVAVMQFLIGLLFASELTSGRWALGAIGILILVSAGFFIWRAQQINQARR